MKTVTSSGDEGHNFVETATGEIDSIALSQNAKGKFQMEAKVYFEAGQELEAVGRLKDIQELIYHRFKGQMAGED